jgi:hypothetical protein
MTPSFQQLNQYLLQKKIDLAHYQKYLYYLQQTSFPQLNQILQKSQIDLNTYYQYLQKKKVPQKAEPAPSSPSSSASSEYYLETLGLYLLENAKISLQELNQILMLLSEEHQEKAFEPKILLQKLVQLHKISIEDFVSLVNTDSLEKKGSRYALFRENQTLAFREKRAISVQKSIGNYQILEELGRGGMGVVYKVYHPGLQQYFAMKTVQSGFFSNESLLKRFQREIQIMGKLKHPGIVQVYDSGVEGEWVYLVLEWVEGTTLEKALKEGANLREILQWFKDILEALAYAHQEKIIHRDLKPENIFMTLGGIPKIGDFGLAKVRETQERRSQKLTRSGAVMGTASYMSPEQATGDTDLLDERSDIYSMGVCFYEALTQRKPFQAKNFPQLLHKIVTEDPLPPSRRKPLLHPDLDTITLKAMEKRPKDRYASASDFANDIECFLSGYPVKARPARLYETFWKWGRRNRGFFLFFVFLLAFIFVGIFFLLFIFHQKEKKLFKQFYQQALQEYYVAEPVGTSSLILDHQKQPYFNALNSLNQALQYDPYATIAEDLKWKIGKILLQNAYRSREFVLAEYLTSEMETLQSLSVPHKEKLKALNQHAQKASSLFQHKRLEIWIQRLRFEEQAPHVYKDAIFEISQISDPTALQYLIQRVEEGAPYFLNPFVEKSEALNKLYPTLALALGRQGSVHAQRPLFQLLEQMSKHLRAREVQKSHK